MSLFWDSIDGDADEVTLGGAALLVSMRTDLEGERERDLWCEHDVYGDTCLWKSFF